MKTIGTALFQRFRRASIQRSLQPDYLPSLGLQRRDALWAIKALRDEPLPLFSAAAERERAVIAEQQEPEVTLRHMTDGHNVIQDYSHTGLTLRQHPIAFLRNDLAARQIVTCEEAMTARDGRWLMTAGLVLVRQKPGSAKGVMFLTIEDETGPANVVVWPKLFDRRRQVVLGSEFSLRRLLKRQFDSRQGASNCSCRNAEIISAS